ncbi:hypothetical protein BC830DRAFT_1062575 [Chytriomyces sp. MP71]|nr:hypothetical protein BC830DRAFT_1062575 [Chytriomyces sp. MP71]
MRYRARYFLPKFFCVRRPTTGMVRSLTKLLTTAVKDAPITMPTARSTTLPRSMKRAKASLRVRASCAARRTSLAITAAASISSCRRNLLTLRSSALSHAVLMDV